MSKKSGFIKKLCGIILSVFVLSSFVGNIEAFAYSEIPDYLDFGDSVVSINAGESKEVWLYAHYDYTYYLGPHSSTGTYCECKFKSGTEYIKLHIGADETEKNVFFYFYIDDPKVPSKDVHDNIEVYVQNITAAPETLAVPIAGGTGTLKKQGNIAMLYNAQGIAMASFSLTKGAGNMASIAIKGVANNGSNYFDVTSDSDSSPVISESDKAVMLANGYAGVCVNGKFKNWP